MIEQTQIRRFDMFARDDGHNSPWIVRETSDDGDYCLWDEVDGAIAELQVSNAELRETIRRLQEENDCLNAQSVKDVLLINELNDKLSRQASGL